MSGCETEVSRTILQSQEWKAWIAERESLFLSEGLAVFDLFAPKAAELFATKRVDSPACRRAFSLGDR